MECLDEQALNDVVHGALEGARLQALEEHVDVCESCRKLAAGVLRANVTGSAQVVPVPTPTLLAPGAVVGRYVVLELIGAGAMSVVYAAYDPQLDRKVSLKLLRADTQTALGDDAAARLTAEAQALARLSHPNVVIVHDVGTFRGQVFIAMEHVAGGSLEAWLTQAPRPWREIVARFVAAGRGLDAAHRASLVHRDFKPANVLVGPDGVVRVTDFGLAAPAPRTAGATTTTLVGTPGYMAPEQLTGFLVGVAAGSSSGGRSPSGGAADARSDQFSFCVSLYQALYGTRPFAAETLEALVEAMRSPPRTPPKSDAPRWVWRVLERGLRRDPSRRFPSMGALIRALDVEVISARRRRLLFGAAAVVVLTLLVGGLVNASRRENRCAAGSQRLAGVWDDRVRGELRAAFTATGAPYAASLFRVSAEALDAASARWLETYRAVCEATWVRGEQSPQLLDARMACLEHRRLALQALTTTLAKGDAAVVERSLGAIGNLESTTACATTTPTRLATEQTDAQRERRLALHAALGETRALIDTAQYSAARVRAEAHVRAATELNDLAARAESEFLLARVQQRTGDAAAAEATLYRTMADAEESGAQRTSAVAAVNLVFVQGLLLAHAEAAHHTAVLAEALIRRGGPDADLEADLQNSLGSTLRLEARLDEARTAYQQALALRQQARGHEDPLVATAWANLGSLLEMTGDLDAALTAHREALRLFEKLQGPDHPDTATELNNIGLVEEDRSHDDEAVSMLSRALAIRERALGPEHPMVATSASNLCLALLHSNRVEEALTHCRRALKVAEKNPGPKHPAFASVTNSLGTALLAHGDVDAAAEAYQRALEVREGLLGPLHPGCAYDLVGLGRVALRRKQPLTAVPLLGRAVALREKASVNPVLKSEAQWLLARALWESKGDRARVDALVGQAQQSLQNAKSAGQRTLTELNSWLEHR